MGSDSAKESCIKQQADLKSLDAGLGMSRSHLVTVQPELAQKNRMTLRELDDLNPVGQQCHPGRLARARSNDWG